MHNSVEWVKLSKRNKRNIFLWIFCWFLLFFENIFFKKKKGKKLGYYMNDGLNRICKFIKLYRLLMTEGN
jgi:hypothetical protein